MKDNSALPPFTLMVDYDGDQGDDPQGFPTKIPPGSKQKFWITWLKQSAITEFFFAGNPTRFA